MTKKEAPKDKDIFDIIKDENNDTTKDILRRAKSYPRMPNYEKYINRNGLFRVKAEFRPHSGMISGTAMKNYYYTLIKEKTLKKDKKLMDDIIKVRTRVLQHRISCEIGLYERGILVAQLKIYKVLIEYGQDIVDFWIGLSIDKSSFPKLADEFHRVMKGKHMVGNVSITQFPIKRHTVEGITTEFEFS